MFSGSNTHTFFVFDNLKNKILAACRSAGCKVSWPLWKDWWSGSLVSSFDFQRNWSRYLKFLNSSTAAEVSLVMQKKKKQQLVSLCGSYGCLWLHLSPHFWISFWMSLSKCLDFGKSGKCFGGNMTIKCNRAVQVVCKDVRAKIIAVLVYRQETVNLLSVCAQHLWGLQAGSTHSSMTVFACLTPCLFTCVHYCCVYPCNRSVLTPLLNSVSQSRYAC